MRYYFTKWWQPPLAILLFSLFVWGMIAVAKAKEPEEEFYLKKYGEHSWKVLTPEDMRQIKIGAH